MGRWPLMAAAMVVYIAFLVLIVAVLLALGIAVSLWMPGVLPWKP